MGLLQSLFGGKRPVQVNGSGGYFKTLTAYTPVFTSWDGKLYESELVRASVDACARHASKLQVTVQGTAKPKLQTRLRLAPNGFMTWSQLLYRSMTILMMQNNCIFVPVVDELGLVTGIYPVLPSSCDVIDVQGEPWLRYTFASGERAAIKASECAVMTRHQYKDDFFGTPNSALNDTLNLMHVQTQGITEAVRNSNTFRFMARVNNFTKPDDLKRERQRFTDENLKADGSGGLLLFPNTYADIHQIESKSYVVDAAQLELIRTNVFNYFGTNMKILQNAAIGDEWNAFYEGCIEPFSIQLSEVLTGMLFSDRERADGTQIFATSNRLQYMSNNDKLNVSAQMADRGIMNRDEIRAIWNLPPLPNGEGQAYIIRGEYHDANEKIGEGTKNAGEE